MDVVKLSIMGCLKLKPFTAKFLLLLMASLAVLVCLLALSLVSKELIMFRLLINCSVCRCVNLKF